MIPSIDTYKKYMEETGEWLPPFILIDYVEVGNCEICKNMVENCGGYIP
jgi:hypothetical protein